MIDRMYIKESPERSFLGFVAILVLCLAPVLYYGGSYLCTKLGITINPNQQAVIDEAKAAELLALLRMTRFLPDKCG